MSNGESGWRISGPVGFVATVAVVALIAAGCSTDPGQNSTREIVLPSHHEMGLPQSAMGGQLILIETCPFIDSGQFRGPVLVVWPENLSVREGSSGFDIMHGETVRASEGDMVVLSGAEFPQVPDPESFSPPIPERCMEKAAAYWVAGSISRA